MREKIRLMSVSIKNHVGRHKGVYIVGGIALATLILVILDRKEQREFWSEAMPHLRNSSLFYDELEKSFE